MKQNAHTDLEKQFRGRKAKFWGSARKCDFEGKERVR